MPDFKPMKSILVRPSGPEAHRGILHFGTHRSRCALGYGGVTARKKEGDGKTPLGRFTLRRIWFRPDRIMRPVSMLPTVEISQKSGWCDDEHHALYNRPVSRPCAARHEYLWRHDRLYDVFFELGINDAPPQKGKGSALFLHLQKNNFNPTLGCIAVNYATMGFLLRHATPDTHIEITEKF